MPSDKSKKTPKAKSPNAKLRVTRTDQNRRLAELVKKNDEIIAKANDTVRKANMSKYIANKRQKKRDAVIDKVLGKAEDIMVVQDEVDEVEQLQNQINSGEVEVIFKPNAGPQTEFLAAPEQEVLYGGAAGGGKSYAMLMDPLRYAGNKNMRALLIRRSMNELTELIGISRELYPRIFKGAKFSKQQNTWTFPSGATMWFSYLDRAEDKYMYQGQAFTWIGIDEITQYPTSEAWDYLRSRLRTTDEELLGNLYMRCSANPGGVGEHWVQKMFVDPAPWGEAFDARDLETGDVFVGIAGVEGIDPELVGKPLFKRRFIPAKLQDNPSLMKDMGYMSSLMSLPEIERRRLLDGEWGISDSSAFPEFHKEIHVVDPFDYPDIYPDGQPPQEWRRFRMCDWGYVAPSAVLWGAVDFSGKIHIYRELYEKGLNPEELACAIFAAEEAETRPMQGVLDSQCWENRGTNALSIADTMIRMGLKWQKCSKGPGSRVNGKAAIHKFLRNDPASGEPKLVFFNSCQNIVRTLPQLPLDKKNTEDIDTDYPEDHLYDALRYGVSSPFASRSISIQESNFRRSLQKRKPVDKTFGF